MQTHIVSMIEVLLGEALRNRLEGYCQSVIGEMRWGPAIRDVALVRNLLGKCDLDAFELAKLSCELQDAIEVLALDLRTPRFVDGRIDVHNTLVDVHNVDVEGRLAEIAGRYIDL